MIACMHNILWQAWTHIPIFPIGLSTQLIQVHKEVCMHISFLCAGLMSLPHWVRSENSKSICNQKSGEYSGHA